MQKNECIKKWNECLALIRKGLNNDTRFNTWFADTRPLSFNNNILSLKIPSHYCFELYEDIFYDIIWSAVHKVFGTDAKIDYIVPILSDSPKSNMVLAGQPKSESQKEQAPVVDVRPKNRKAKQQNFDSNLNPALTFDNYCVSGSNKLPFTIAENIARNPVNSNFNPFFLYGDVGVGKTHLMHAIGLKVKNLFPYKKVLFLPMKEFQRLYANAVLKKTIPNFIEWFKMIDVLLFDDLQELTDKTKTLKDALFPIFNHLHLSGKQLVFTCDRPPMELEGMEDRLIDRFKWGVTEKLNKPDSSLRRKILTFKAKKNGIDLPDDVIETIVSAPINSVREIEGIVLGIMTHSITMGVDIDVSLAKMVMKNSIKASKKRSINFDMIVEAVADKFSLNPDVIFSKSKLREVSEARMVIMYLAGNMIGLSSSAIGKKLNRKHSTVIHGIRTISERMNIDENLSENISSIKVELRKVR